MENTTWGKEFLKELEAEVPATRKCLERIPDKLYDYKPHEKSMQLGYLTLLVAEMPRWLTKMIQDGVIDLLTYDNIQLSTTEALVKHFDDNIAEVKKVLEEVPDETMTKIFTLKRGDQVLMETPMQDSLNSTINHWVHHRGQLTVYMRLNDIPVPSIYGPSADDRGF